MHLICRFYFKKNEETPLIYLLSFKHNKDNVHEHSRSVKSPSRGLVFRQVVSILEFR